MVPGTPGLKPVRSGYASGVPELPDVEGFRRVVAEHAVNRRIESVDVHDSQILRDVSAARFQDALRDQYLGQPQRHGKWLLVPAADADFPCVLMHFGMTGMVLWSAPDEQPHPHDRVVFHLSGGDLRYRDMRKLTGIRLADKQSDVDEVLAELGPDAFSVEADRYRDRLVRTRRQIKPALMDQSVVAGLGNLCADEILWHARINPRRATTDLSNDDFALLHRKMRSVLRQAARTGCVPDWPSWLTGHRDQPNGQCPRCSEILRQSKTGGRRTVWCPVCQSR